MTAWTCERMIPKLRLDFWHNEDPRYYTNVAADGQRYSIRPDAFCQISVLQDGWTSYPLLFEFDRSTMDHATMRRKYRGYFLLWRNHLRAATGWPWVTLPAGLCLLRPGARNRRSVGWYGVVRLDDSLERCSVGWGGGSGSVLRE